MRKLSHQILVTAICAMAIFGAQSALAQYSTETQEASAQRVLDEINTFLDKANTAIDEGEAAESAGHYATACEAYRRAIAYNESAIAAHTGYAANEGVSYRKISDSIDNIRRHTDNIESSAGRVCGKSDPPPTYSSPSTGSIEPESRSIEPHHEPEPEPYRDIVLSPSEEDLKESRRLNNVARYQFLDKNKNDEGCLSSRIALSFAIDALARWAGSPWVVEPLETNIAEAKNWLDTQNCPLPNVAADMYETMGLEAAKAKVAYKAALEAIRVDNSAEACRQYRIAENGYLEAKSWNTKASTAPGHEGLSDAEYMKNDTALARIAEGIKSESKGACLKAGMSDD